MFYETARLEGSVEITMKREDVKVSLRHLEYLFDTTYFGLMSSRSRGEDGCLAGTWYRIRLGLGLAY